MRILVLADIDELHWQTGGGEADLLLSCGDLFDQVIVEAAQAYHCPQIFAVKGNHDQGRPFASPIEELHLRVCNYGGLRFGGLNGAWRYKPRGAFLYTQEAVGEMLAGFAAVDVLVAHNAPFGIHHRDEGAHVGFMGLATYIERVKPKLVVHGHQHLNGETRLGSTRIVGVHGHRLLEI